MEHDLILQLELAKAAFRMTFDQFDSAHDPTFVDKAIAVLTDRFAVSDLIKYFNFQTRKLNLLSTITPDDLVDLYGFVVGSYDPKDGVISPSLTADWSETLLVLTFGENVIPFGEVKDVFGVDYLTHWIERKLDFREVS